MVWGGAIASRRVVCACRRCGSLPKRCMRTAASAGSGPICPPPCCTSRVPLAMQLMTARDFPWVLPGWCIANRIEVRGPLPALGTYAVSVHVGEPRSHPRGTEFDVITTATLMTLEVWQEASTYLSRGAELPTSGEPAPRRLARRSRSIRPPRIWRSPADIGRRYASVSGTATRSTCIRWPPDCSASPSSIAHGMWTLAVSGTGGGSPPARYVVEAGFFSRCCFACAALAVADAPRARPCIVVARESQRGGGCVWA